ncbi:AfsR/SARP family transcriptional regulator [Micromonospora luteifusca]|uniref:AfsR/SARP family transcriptional regulator n=1 Tax=Micromonospora luteifusca TaxID=709860 RepID=UPI0033A9D9F5
MPEGPPTAPPSPSLKAPTGTGVVRYRILGPVEVWSVRGWRGIPQAKCRALLAVLLINANRLVPSEDLERQLWSDQSPCTPRKLVQHYVHRLRRLLHDPRGQALCTRPNGYQLNVAADDVDVEEFKALVAVGRRTLATGAADAAAAELGRALALWRGPAMADVLDVPAVAGSAARLTELRLNATEAWIRAEVNCGRSDVMVAELESLIAEHPLREHFWELLMVALHKAGRQAEALAASRRLRRMLREDLGIDPCSNVQRLERAILLGEDVDVSRLG